MYEDSIEFQSITPDWQASLNSSGALEPLLTVLGFVWFFVLAFYIYSAICWLYIARRTNTANGWFAFIPILNTVLMLQIAKRPIWWIILFFVPIANIVVAIMVYLDILKVLKRPWWWVIMQFIPVVNLVFLGFMAWGTSDTTLAEPTVIPPTTK